jgi:hypothetical protein
MAPSYVGKMFSFEVPAFARASFSVLPTFDPETNIVRIPAEIVITWLTHTIVDNCFTPIEAVGNLITDEMINLSMDMIDDVVWMQLAISFQSIIESADKRAQMTRAFVQAYCLQAAHKSGFNQIRMNLKRLKNLITDTGSAFTDCLKRKCPKLYEWRTMLIEIGVVAGAVVIVCGAWKALGNMGILPSFPTWSQHASGDHSTPRSARVDVVRAGTHYVSQAAYDQNAEDLVNHKLRKHIYHVKVGPSSTNGIAIKGQNLLVPSHLIHHAQTGDDIILSSAFCDPIVFSFDEANVINVPNVDASIITNIKRMPMAPDFRKHLVTDSDLKYISTTPVMLVGYDAQANISTKYGNAYPLNEYSTHSVEAKPFDPPEKVRPLYILRHGWKYNIPGATGSCMSVLCANNSAVQHKILGFHITTLRNEGISQLITAEMLTFLDGAMCASEAFYDLLEEPGKGRIGEGYVLHGLIPKHLGDHTPTKTAILPSPIADRAFLHTTEPAILSSADPRNTKNLNPFHNGLTKYETRTLPFDPVNRKVVGEWLSTDVISNITTDVPSHFIEELVVVNGIPGRPHYKGIELNTSPGWPFKLHSTGGKHEFFVGNPTERMIRNDIRDSVYETLSEMIKGTAPNWIWPHVLKDERRPLAKIAAVKTRLITAAPLDCTIITRFLTMHFTAGLYRSFDTTFSNVGINPLGTDWTALYQRARSHGGYCFDGDYSAFDGILDPDLMSNAMDAINDWTFRFSSSYSIFFSDGREIILNKAQHRLCLDALLASFTHTTQLLGRLLHSKVQGNPSGNPLTVVLNTMVNFQYLALAYIDIFSHFHLSYSYSLFKKQIFLAIYGDDFFVSTTEDVIKYYNGDNVASFLSSHHITMTSATKSNAFEILPLSKIQYLKRKFRQLENTRYPIYTAPIDPNTLQELTNWYRKCPDPTVQFRTQLEAAMIECHAHGREFYSSFLAKLNRALNEAGLAPLPSEFDLYDRQFRQQFDL